MLFAGFLSGRYGVEFWGSVSGACILESGNVRGLSGMFSGL